MEMSKNPLAKNGLLLPKNRHVQNVLSFNNWLMHWKPFCSALPSMNVWNKFHLTENLPVSFSVMVKSVRVTDLRHLIMLFGYPLFSFLRGTGYK